MAPPVATASVYDAPTTALNLKAVNGKNGSESLADFAEDYDGNYRFAPIEEAQVSRAMIKRYVRLDIDNRGGIHMLTAARRQVLRHDV
jgi:thiamine thiazole synthase